MFIIEIRMDQEAYTLYLLTDTRIRFLVRRACANPEAYSDDDRQIFRAQIERCSVYLARFRDCLGRIEALG